MTAVPLEAAARNLKEMLEGMEFGQTVTVVDPGGEPLALVVSLRRTQRQAKSLEDWEAEWDALAEAVGKAWKSDKSAVEVVSEMRR